MNARLLLTACALLTAAPVARAADTDDNCLPVGDAIKRVFGAAHTKQTYLVLAQLDFARGMYAASPPAGEYPRQSHATLIETDEKGAVIFQADGVSCATMLLTSDMVGVLNAFGRQEQTF